MSDEHDHIEHHSEHEQGHSPEEQPEDSEHKHPEAGAPAEHDHAAYEAHGTVAELHTHGVDIAEDAIGVPADLQDHAEHDTEHECHADHTGHEEMFRRRFWVSLALSIPVLVYSPSVQDWFNLTAPPFPSSEWGAAILSIIIFAYGGTPFLRLMVPDLRLRRPGMMTLISLAISVALVYSLAVQLVLEWQTFWWELVLLIDVMLLGHWLEMRSMRQASGALDELAKLMPDTAERIDAAGNTSEVPINKLKAGVGTPACRIDPA